MIRKEGGSIPEPFYLWAEGGTNMDAQDRQDGNHLDLVKRLNSSFGLSNLMRRPMGIPVALNRS
jgi:hypothetical protein